jgi:hypothetical protein
MLCSMTSHLPQAWSIFSWLPTHISYVIYICHNKFNNYNLQRKVFEFNLKNNYVQPLYSAVQGSLHVLLSLAAPFWISTDHETIRYPSLQLFESHAP